MVILKTRMMNIVLFISCAFACVSAFENSDNFINEINRKQNFWRAGRNFPENTPLSTLKGLLGMRFLSEKIKKRIPIKYHHVKADKLPESFDAREKWPKCRSIKEIADQSSCGSCWAVAVASAISDRICIHSDGKLQPEISARNLMSCERRSFGCKGGFPYFAWKFWRTNGLVTGGPFGSNIGCQPYSFAPCEHRTTRSIPPCPSKMYDTPKCVTSCDNSTINYKADLIQGSDIYTVSTKEKQIKAEIYKNGPVVAGFTVFSDFLQYKSGVYVKTSNTSKGGHAVRVIGWGVENGTKYWLVANSWNEDWGDKGLFKIRRGVDECEFEKGITAGLPK